jgi:uncharacterized RDD family membrane protein YckC
MSPARHMVQPGGAPPTARPSRALAGAVPSPVVRVVWIAAIVLLVVALAAWGTTCTGPRPQPTGETVPPGQTTATTATTLAPAGPAAKAPGG